ncbi:MAG: superoxide dismutase [Fe] [Bdellovibrio sp.]|nr:superoxide dismutase [Fe] [Bdellovibrio sp.]
MEHKLPALPWPKDSLAPHISPETIDFHYGKHHAAYVAKLNELIKGTALAELPLEEIIKKAQGPTFNNAAQVWNHSFYWNCMTPRGGGAPTEKVAELIKKKWGGFEKFKEVWSNSAVSNFGSGWTWLVKTATGDLEIVNTSNAGCPLTEGQKPILTIDVWEHAYYIDYRNARANYVAAFWNVVNWDFVAKNL